MMKETLTRPVPIPKGARRDVYYDSQEIVQNEAVLDFFAPSPNRSVPDNNYVSNAFPGEAVRRIYGLSFSLKKQFIADDAANDIDARAILNGVKDAGIVVTADQDSTEFLRTGMSDHFNFEGTHLQTSLSAAADPAAADSLVATESNIVTIQASGLYRLPDAFDLATNQVISVTVTFADASVFPTNANWDDAGESHLEMLCKLYLAEIQPA